MNAIEAFADVEFVTNDDGKVEQPDVEVAEAPDESSEEEGPKKDIQLDSISMDLGGDSFADADHAREVSDKSDSKVQAEEKEEEEEEEDDQEDIDFQALRLYYAHIVAGDREFNNLYFYEHELSG